MAKAKRKRRKPSTKIVYHHAAYPVRKEGARNWSQREICFAVTSQEHQRIWRIQNLKPETISKGFWNSLRVLMALYEPFARELEEKNKEEDAVTDME